MRKVNSIHKLANTFDLCSKRARLKIDSKKMISRSDASQSKMAFKP